MGKLLRFRGTQARQGDTDEGWMFDGLDALAVVIEDLDPVAVEAGLNRTNIQLRIESRLSEAGIPVAPLLGAAEGEGVAVLYVAIGAERHASGPVVCSLSLQVAEGAVLARDPEKGGGVTTWLTNATWLSSVGDLERDVMEALDEGLANLERSFLVGQRA